MPAHQGVRKTAWHALDETPGGPALAVPADNTQLMDNVHAVNQVSPARNACRTIQLAPRTERFAGPALAFRKCKT